jgi:putative transposase
MRKWRGSSDMPRQARLDVPGTLHHVMIRRIEKGKIVDDSQDRQGFVEIMEKAALENDTGRVKNVKQV